MHRSSQAPVSSTAELEKKLRQVLRNRDGGPFSDVVQNVRVQLRDALASAILNDYEGSGTRDLEGTLWKAAHYKIIEEFRKTLKEIHGNARRSGRSEERKDVRLLTAHFRAFLAEATAFYVRFICRLQRHFKLHGRGIDAVVEQLSIAVDSEDTIEPSESQEHIPDAMQTTAIGSCYRSLIFLGDLARYREIYADRKETNWSTARMFYNMAIQLMPDSGNPYNQLAVIASYAGDELLAVEYYLRSLAISKPFATAFENLDILFEKVQKRTESAKTAPSPVKGLEDQFIGLVGNLIGKSKSLDDFMTIKTAWLSSFRRLLGEGALPADVLMRYSVVIMAVVHLVRQEAFKSKTSNSQASWTTADNSLAGSSEIAAFAISMIRAVVDNTLDTLKHANLSDISGSDSIPANIDENMPTILIMMAWLKSQWQESHTIPAQNKDFWKSIASFLTRLAEVDVDLSSSEFHMTSEETHLEGFVALRRYFADLKASSNVDEHAKTLQADRDPTASVRFVHILLIGVFFAESKVFYLSTNDNSSDKGLIFTVERPTKGKLISPAQALRKLGQNSLLMSSQASLTLKGLTQRSASSGPFEATASPVPGLKRSASGQPSGQWLSEGSSMEMTAGQPLSSMTQQSAGGVDEDAFGHKIMLPSSDLNHFSFTQRSTAPIAVPQSLRPESRQGQSGDVSKMFGTSSDAVNTMAFLGLGSPERQRGAPGAVAGESIQIDANASVRSSGLGKTAAGIRGTVDATRPGISSCEVRPKLHAISPPAPISPPGLGGFPAHDRRLSDAQRIASAPLPEMAVPWQGEYAFPFASPTAPPNRRPSAPGWTDTAPAGLGGGGTALSWVAFNSASGHAPLASPTWMQPTSTLTTAPPMSHLSGVVASADSSNSQYGISSSGQGRNVWG
ncbi:hypothetical protein DFJ77DRAFT_451699 [Powellomyces hirtus]|nr:hypothetical protein DFJ77DRAFT_451699 [Powellomyces hirtus]